MNGFFVRGLVAAVALGACQGCNSSEDTGAIETSATVTGASAVASGGARPKLHPLESYCVSFELEGLMHGSWEECSKDHGYNRYELQKTEISIGGFTQRDEKRVVYREDEIYTVKPDGSATKAKNTMFAGIVEAMAQDPRAFQSAFVQEMGFELTTDTKDVAGHVCKVATGPMGSLCITDDALVLHMNTMGQIRRATEVRIGDSGDAANYAIPENAADVPSLGEIQDMLKGLRPPSDG